MRPKTYILLLTVLPALLLFSCNDEKELTIADQEAAIDSYISQNFQDYPVIRRNGSNRIKLDTTAITLEDSLEFGDSLHFYYAGYILKTASKYPTPTTPSRRYCSRKNACAADWSTVFTE